MAKKSGRKLTPAGYAKKWGLSLNWVRSLVRRGLLPSVFRKDAPVPFYEIDADTKPPKLRRGRPPGDEVKCSACGRRGHDRSRHER